MVFVKDHVMYIVWLVKKSLDTPTSDLGLRKVLKDLFIFVTLSVVGAFITISFLWKTYNILDYSEFYFYILYHICKYQYFISVVIFITQVIIASLSLLHVYECVQLFKTNFKSIMALSCIMILSRKLFDKFLW